MKLETLLHKPPTCRVVLEHALPEPRVRSPTWLSSTFGPKSTDPAAARCSAAYHVCSQNFRSSSCMPAMVGWVGAMATCVPLHSQVALE